MIFDIPPLTPGWWFGPGFSFIKKIDFWFFFVNLLFKMLRIKNTLSGKKEEFKEINKGVVKIYQCGATVYSDQHIGNLRAFVLGDFIFRSLKYLEYEVIFVRNYTDVGHLVSDADEGEDKMNKASLKEKIKPLEIAEKYIKQIENDEKRLNNLEPTYRPRATEHIKEQIEMVEILLKKGFAYQTDLAVYFDISKIKDYHKLSGQKIEENICGAGHGNVYDKEKKNKEDFALWFFKTGVHEKALQYWPSPFKSSLVKNGEGFPGWHIECSAMAKKFLGDRLDIKMGGVEHIAIHHTNEMAQSESANGVKYANYWIHNEHLNFNGKKMSKSSGNYLLLDDLIKQNFDPLDLRYFFLQAHYRSKQNFTLEALKASSRARKKILNKIKTFKDGGKIIDNYKKEFISKLEDDFSIPEALSVLWRLLNSGEKEEDKKATILDFDKVFGLKLSESIRDEYLDFHELDEEIKNILIERKKARELKDWKKSDFLRDELKKKGFEVFDGKDGVKIKRASDFNK